MKKYLLIVISSVIFLSVVGSRAENLWVTDEARLSVTKIFQNISPADAKPGSIVASQARDNPDYYFHWVRDAALTIDSLVLVYKNITDENGKQILRNKFSEYLDFTRGIQNTPTLTGLGEPKFNVDGTAYNEPWGRPQNDSPALRALSLIHWAQILIGEGHADFVSQNLYDGTANSVIKKDLEYVAQHWNETSFDLWEEVRGFHFYTLMVQRRSMIEGAQLAAALGDSGASSWYSQQSKKIEQKLSTFWDANRGYITATQGRVEGLDYKKSGLDTAIILGVIHGSLDDGFFSPVDSRTQATIDRLETVFAQLYPINQSANAPGVAIGRYPEDIYGGSNFNGGNPWPLCTLAFAEYYYKKAELLLNRNRSAEAQEAFNKAELFVARVRYHANGDGSLNEQISRNNGYMTSVQDLTWNYAAVLTTYLARNKTINH